MYTGLELILPKVCPSCGHSGYITKQRWNGTQNDHCNKCGVSFNKYGQSKDAEPNQQHIRTEQAATLLLHCQNTPKLGANYAKKHGISTELLTDLTTARLLHQPAPDIYLTSSRGKRFLQTRQALLNIAHQQQTRRTQ